MSEPTSSGDKSMHDSDSEISALYASGRKETPPPQLDDKILQAARAALPEKQPAGDRRSLPWLTGLAATVVLGILLVQLYPERPTEQVIAQADQQRNRNLEAPMKEEAKLKNGYLAESNVLDMSAAPAAKRLQADRPAMETTAMEADSDAGLTVSAEAVKAYAEIIELYKAGRIDAAVEAYLTFAKQFPEFEAPVADQTIWKALQERTRDPQ